METFNFYLDTKVTTWMRTNFEIEAKSLEEAKKKAIEFHKKGNTGNIGWEEVESVREEMSLEDNHGQPTNELYCEDDDTAIWNNVDQTLPG